eukprot:XP_016657792.1 PREDICTED: uncharacterized protein LOC107883005 [Acyrthosiphon pisum]
MTEAVESGKDTCSLFINNGDDLLTLKKVVSKKTDKDVEKQKLSESVETNGSEFNGNHSKTDTINFDVDNTSSLDPNFEMDSDTDLNITIGSIRTQEDQESETNYILNENPIEVNQADVSDGEKDIQVKSIKNLDVPYHNKSHELKDNNSELDIIASPASSYNISARAPIRSYKNLDSVLENDNFILENEILNNKRKRKFEDSAEEDQKSTKIRKLWSLMKYPFQKKTYCTSKTEEKNTQHSFETDDEIEDNTCNIM